MIAQRDKAQFDSVWSQKDPIRLLKDYIPGEDQRIEFCIQHLPIGKKFLDIGCVAGYLSAQMGDCYEEVYGVDIAPAAVASARSKQVEAFQVNFNAKLFPFETRTIDTATLLATIQNIYDLDFILQEIQRVLKPGGLLIIAVLNMRAFWRITRLAAGSFPRSSKYDLGYDGGTIHYFCYRDMEKLLHKYCFRTSFGGGIFFIPAVFNRIPGRGVPGLVKREFFAAEFVIGACT